MITDTIKENAPGEMRNGRSKPQTILVFHG